VSTVAVGESFFALARYRVEHPVYSLSPVNQPSVPVGGAASTAVTLNSIDGLHAPVTVHVAGQPDGSGLPPGVTASFDGHGNQAELTPAPFGSVSSTLTIAANATVTPGTYHFFIVPNPDSADHSHAVFFSANVTTTVAAVANVVTAFQAANAIFNLGTPNAPGLADALRTKLANLQAAVDAGDAKTAASTLTLFINQVQAQNGRQITTTATIDGVTFVPASVLIGDARDLMAHLNEP
jgi:hypothetical protein